MLLEGMVLGAMTFAGYMLLVKNLPPGFKAWMIRHPLASDLVLVVIFYMVMGMSVTSHFAVAAMTLCNYAYMGIKRNPQEWGWIEDYAKAGYQKMMDGINQLKNLAPKKSEEVKA